MQAAPGLPGLAHLGAARIRVRSLMAALAEKRAELEAAHPGEPIPVEAEAKSAAFPKPRAGRDAGRLPWWQAAQRAKAPTRAGRRTEVFCAVQVYGGCSYNPPYSPPTFAPSAK